MTDQQTFEIPVQIAELYESKFVPAIFAEWAPRILDAAAVGDGSRVLDVACGTGVVARAAAERVGETGHVVGVDRNEAMLTVAERLAPDIRWQVGDASELPAADGSFDAVTCQMAMMFFPDRVGALREFARITTADGRVAIVVPASLDDQPAYRAFVDAAVDHAGAGARPLLSSYWTCGDTAQLRAEADAGGLVVDDIATVSGTARFSSPADLVATEIGASPLADRVSADVAAAITADVARKLAGYIDDDRFHVPLVCHVVTAHPAT